ncbi:MAG: outer membrane beta-barrel protein, partial [Bacteroidota bacterium]
MAGKYGIVTFMFCALTWLGANAQERVVTVGLQLKPIIPSSILGTATTDLTFNDIDYSVDQKVGFAGGMVIRWGLTKNFSLETGINYVNRNYRAEIVDNITNETKNTDFTIVGYEVPVLGLVYIRLSREIFMNAAFGLSLDMYPSDVATGTLADFTQESIRTSWIQPSLLANVGWEYRTDKSGYFYVGGSFHRPFRRSYDTVITQTRPTEIVDAVLELSGQYLTIDFRYFFHEDPQKKKARKKRVKYDNPNDW